MGNRGAERRIFEMRAEELAGRALVPGSPLACMDAVAGENVEAACEKALFASPASVAAASSYVAARLTLLASMGRYSARGDAKIDDVILPLRRALEADRFGFLAHMLAVRDGCTSENCKALAVLRDPTRVRANLSAATLDHYLEHYLALWAAAPDGAVADGTQAPSTAAQPNAQAARKPVNIDFPTAASIPAVSIMNPEPAGPVLPGVAAAAASNTNQQATSSAPHRARKQASNPPAAAAVQAVSSSPAASEPIWPEPVPPPPTPQPPAASASAGPIQLNPPSTATPAATTSRTQ
ncbi:MAG: hypothetical protein P4L80_09025 [Xanthobacteraceae bacterium]|nr:hypothetical protein [Xanthobacteraceae bacterium]